MHAHRQYGGADAVADGAPKGAADGAAHTLTDQCRVLVGANIHGLGVRGNVGRMLRVQRVVLGRRRPLSPGHLRQGPVRMLCHANAQPDRASVRLAGADARDPGAVRPLLPRPHERADARAIAAPDDSGAVSASDY